ncbi:MAG: YfhO family protein, partial [Flavobacteriaceae bacterium]|nr:YfhO family protein [Flavobacteriaceae bacterium]
FKSAIPGLDFASPYDQELRDQLGTPLVEAIRDDRASLFVTDTMRTLIFVLLAAVALWMFLKEKLKQNTVIAILAVLVIIDLVGVNWRYVNNDDFVNARIMNQPFQKNPADIQILEDEGHFRVYDITTNPFSSGRASYFHNALGGYHAAKPGRMQDLDDYFLADGDIGILNMMNVRYIIGQSPNGGPVAQRNPFTNGNAWFVENVLIAENANEELLLLDSLDTKKTVVIHNEFKEGLPLDNIVRDSTATIDLTEVRPDYMVYESSSKSPQLAVFSEVYYPKGWNAYLNGEAVEYIRANYVLRAMALPAGNHKIEFRFEPKVIQTGSTISLSSFILLILILAGGLWYYRKQEKNDSEETV